MQTYTFQTPLIHAKTNYGNITVTVNYNFNSSCKYKDYDIYDISYDRSLVELWEYVYMSGNDLDKVVEPIVLEHVDEMTEREDNEREYWRKQKGNNDADHSILNRQFIQP